MVIYLALDLIYIIYLIANLYRLQNKYLDQIKMKFKWTIQNYQIQNVTTNYL